jgi:hypothetical protein
MTRDTKPLAIGAEVDARIGACGQRGTIVELLTLPHSGTQLVGVRTADGRTAWVDPIYVHVPRLAAGASA